MIKGNRKGAAISRKDWHFIRQAAQSWSKSSFVGLRTRALVLLCASSGIRLSEAISLNLDQVIHKENGSDWQIRSKVWLKQHQVKGKREGRWFTIPRRAKAVLRTYLDAAIQRSALKIPPPKNAPIFFTTKKTGKSNAYCRLSKRMAQQSFSILQRKAQIERPYRFHDLRHTFTSRFSKAVNGDPYKIAQAAGFKSLETSIRYVDIEYDADIAPVIEEIGERL